MNGPKDGAARPGATPEPSLSSNGRRALWLATVPLLALLAYFAAHFLLFSYWKIRYPFPLEVGEGEVLNYAAILASDDRLYAPLQRHAATIVNYPPVVPALVEAFLDPEKPSFGPGRLLAVLATLVIAAMAVAVTRRRGAPWPLAILPAFLFLANPGVAPFANFLRVDVFALAFSFAGLSIFLAYSGVEGVLLSVPFFLLGLFAKQSTVFAPLAVAAYLAVNDRKRLALFLALLVGLGGLLLGLAEGVTGGEFLRHLVVYTVDGWSGARLASFLGDMLAHPAGINGLLALAALGCWLAWSRKGGPRDPGWYYLPSAALSLALLGKYGSSVYYFDEFALAASLTVAWGGTVLLRSREPGGKGFPLAAALVSAPLLVAYVVAFHYFTSDLVPVARYRRDVRVERLVRQIKWPIFAEDIGLLVVAGKRPPFPNTYSLTSAIERGSWDPTWLLEDIRSGRFKLIYTESDLAAPDAATQERIHPAIRKAIEESYGPPGDSDVAFVYLPTVIWNAPPPAPEK